MKPDEQRIKIAEACGKSVELYNRGVEGFLECCYNSKIPDYLNDLNAMFVAEKFLAENHPDAKWREYCDRVSFCATAAQRAEAFLRAVGRWEA